MSEENIEYISKSDNNFAATFVDHHILPDINFNSHSLIKSNIFGFKTSNKSIYFLQTKYTIKKLKYRF